MPNPDASNHTSSLESPASRTENHSALRLWRRPLARVRTRTLAGVAALGLSFSAGCLGAGCKQAPEEGRPYGTEELSIPDICKPIYLEVLDRPHGILDLVGEEDSGQDGVDSSDIKADVSLSAINSESSSETVPDILGGRLRRKDSRISVFEMSPEGAGETRMIFTPDVEDYEDLLLMHPQIARRSLNEKPRKAHKRDRMFRKKRAEMWATIEMARIIENQTRYSLQTLLDCYDMDGEDVDETLLAPYPPEFTDELMESLAHEAEMGFDPMARVRPDQVFGEPFTMPYFGPQDESGLDKEFSYLLEEPSGGKHNYPYLQFRAVPGDNLEIILEQLLRADDEFDLPKLIAQVKLISPEGKWRVPLSIVDPEQYKNDILWIAFRDYEMASYPKRASSTDRRTLRGQRQSFQTEYHEEQAYPAFTEENREDLLQTSGVVPVPEEGEGFVCDRIYTYDEDHEDLARYTHPETLALIERVAKHVNDSFHEEHGLPENLQIRLFVNALGRTDWYQHKKLRPTNGNATSETSSHEYYNAADLSYLRAQIVDTQTGAVIEFTAENHPRTMAGIEALMTKSIADAIREEAAFARREVTNRCFHVVGRRIGEPEAEVELVTGEEGGPQDE